MSPRVDPSKGRYFALRWLGISNRTGTVPMIAASLTRECTRGSLLQSSSSTS